MLKYEYGIFGPEELLVIVVINGNIVKFSLASEGTKVSLHALHTLLGLIV